MNVPPVVVIEENRLTPEAWVTIRLALKMHMQYLSEKIKLDMSHLQVGNADAEALGSANQKMWGEQLANAKAVVAGLTMLMEAKR